MRQGKFRRPMSYWVPAAEELEVLNGLILEMSAMRRLFQRVFHPALGETYEYHCNIFNREIDQA
jgi:hypothetical protein